MTREQHLLVCLAEECSEVQKLIMKMLRFGVIKEGDDPHVTLKGREVEPNHTLLQEELIDLGTIIDMLQDEGFLSWSEKEVDSLVEAKREKVEKYMEYAHSLGQLEIK